MLKKILSLLYGVYLIAASFFLILENRRIYSTYAWLLRESSRPWLTKGYSS